MDGTDRAKIRRMRFLVPAIATLGLVALTAGCGDDEQETSTAVTPAPPPADRAQPADGAESPGDRDSDGTQGSRKPESEEAVVARVIRDYVHALDDRNGERACALFVPGAIDEVDLPRDRGGCGASLSASIGYRDPRGLPVWKTARVSEVLSVEVDGDAAKVVATTITLFADRDEPSIEDDVVYLVRRDGGWLLAKPSSILYRAVGIADIPPSVLAAP
jgi:hypothetical protein